MRHVLLSAAAVIAASVWTGTAQADPYRWCAQNVGETGATNCYFVTIEQCQAAVSGAGGFCTPNGFYTGPDGTARERRRPRR